MANRILHITSPFLLRLSPLTSLLSWLSWLTWLLAPLPLSWLSWLSPLAALLSWLTRLSRLAGLSPLTSLTWLSIGSCPWLTIGSGSGPWLHITWLSVTGLAIPSWLSRLAVSSGLAVLSWLGRLTVASLLSVATLLAAISSLLSAAGKQFQSIVKLDFVDPLVIVLVDELDRLHGLLLGNIHGAAHFLEDLIKKLCQLIHIKGSGSVPVVLPEDFINVLPELGV